jgi:hypothetical protein
MEWRTNKKALRTRENKKRTVKTLTKMEKKAKNIQMSTVTKKIVKKTELVS